MGTRVSVEREPCPFGGGRFRLHLRSTGNAFVRNIAFRCEPAGVPAVAGSAAELGPWPCSTTSRFIGASKRSS